MFSLSIQSRTGTTELTHNKDYEVVKVTGLNPPGATIATSTIPGFDGAKFNSSRVGTRNIVITIIPNPPIDVNRNKLYEMFEVKEKVRIYYSNAIRDVYIDGYTETFEFDLFSQREQMQVSVLCPEPYFIGTSDSKVNDYSHIVPLFEAPFSLPDEGISLGEIIETPARFTNHGHVESGVIFEITFTGETDNLTIWDEREKKKFTVVYHFLPYDTLRINTNKGNKEVVVVRQGISYNLMNLVTGESEWITAATGENAYSITADNGNNNIHAKIEWQELYKGV